MASETKGKTPEGRAAFDTSSPQLEGSIPGAATGRAEGDVQNAQTPGPDDRRRSIAEAAYYRAERRGFAPGHEDGDWLEAEREAAAGPAGSTRDQDVVDDLNACLRSELSAIETYHQALEKHRQHSRDAKFQQLTRMLEEHREAASRLRSLIHQKGGRPSEDSGAWGAWSRTVMGAAKLFGDNAALKALKEGEEDGMKQYERMTRDSTTSDDVRSIASVFMAKQQEHIRHLDAMIDAA